MSQTKKQKHPLHKEVAWLRKNWPFVEVANNFKGGILVITISMWSAGGQGRTFLEDQMEECITYVKKKNANNQLTLQI